MSPSFGSLVFTPAVKALQERYGSRKQYARMEESGGSPDGKPTGLGPEEQEYFGERDTFYIASCGATGWPYVQHRGGPKGFLKVLDPHTIAFADFRGNKQYITTGNLMTDDRVALILMDYPNRLRLKILGNAQVFEGDNAKEWIGKVRDPEYKAVIERVFVIRVDGFDWNCQQHIIPRFTEEEIRDVLAPVEKHVRDLERDNENLKKQIARFSK